MIFAAAPRWGLACCVLVPALAIGAARLFSPAIGPTQAVAAEAAPARVKPAADDTPQPRSTTDDPARVIAIRDLLSTPVTQSPMVDQSPVMRGSTVVAMPPKPVPVIPAFTLTSIAGGARQSIAVIDGKLRRTGEDLGAGWTVAEIDPSVGQVKVTGPEGETMTLSVRH